jgi:hypothetical protein
MENAKINSINEDKEAYTAQKSYVDELSDTDSPLGLSDEELKEISILI